MIHMGKGLVNWWWTWVYEMLNQEGWQLGELVVSFLLFLGCFLNQWELSSAFTVLLKDVQKNRWLNEVLSRFKVSPKLSGLSYIYVNAECPTRGRTWELCLFSPRAQEFPAAHAYDQTCMVMDGKRFHTPPNPKINQNFNYFIRRTMVVPGYVIPVAWLSFLVFQSTAAR